jgi:hypothetical protein
MTTSARRVGSVGTVEHCGALLTLIDTDCHWLPLIATDLPLIASVGTVERLCALRLRLRRARECRRPSKPL